MRDPLALLPHAMAFQVISLVVPISGLAAQQSVAPPAIPLAFDGITVVDVTDGKLPPA